MKKAKVPLLAAQADPDSAASSGDDFVDNNLDEKKRRQKKYVRVDSDLPEMSQEERRRDMKIAAKNKTAELKQKAVRAVKLTVGGGEGDDPHYRQPHWSVGT